MFNRAFDLLGTTFTMYINLVDGGDLAVIFLSAGIGGGFLLGFRFSSFLLLENKKQNNLSKKKKPKIFEESKGKYHRECPRK